jgi:hypothetical protein
MALVASLQSLKPTPSKELLALRCAIQVSYSRNDEGLITDGIL